MSSMRTSALLFLVFAFPSVTASAQTRAPVASYRAVSAAEIGYALNDWRRLRQSDGYAFADFARFLNANPGWPEESRMRRAAERQMRAAASMAPQ